MQNEPFSTEKTKINKKQLIKTIARTLWAISKKIYRFIFYKLAMIEVINGKTTKRTYIARSFKRRK